MDRIPPARINTAEINLENIEELFTYQPWNNDQTARGVAIRTALVEAGKVILRRSPRCPLRTRALNALFDARMLANAAISFEEREEPGIYYSTKFDGDKDK